MSLSCQNQPGIPLGSITAQLASKSFWTGTMLEERLKQIAHTVLQETYSKPVQKSMECLENNDFNERESKKLGENEQERELKSPCSSRGDSNANSHGFRTPPYLSPGSTRRLQWRDDLFL